MTLARLRSHVPAGAQGQADNPLTVTRREDRRHLLASGITSVVALTYFLTVIVYSVNIPKVDDIDVFFRFPLAVQDAPTWRERTALFLTGHNEHYIVFTRILHYLSYATLGTINFTALLFVGNAAIFLFVWLLYREFVLPRRVRLLLFVPAVLLIFVPSYHEASLWATASIQNFWIYPVALLAFGMATRPGILPSIVASGLAVAAVGIQGNGCFVLLLLGVLALREKQFVRSGIWMMLFIVAAYLQSRVGQHHVVNGYFLDLVWQYVSYSLAFVGSGVGAPFLSFDVALLSGVAIAVAAVVLLPRFAVAPPLYALLLFNLLTAAANALARAHVGAQLVMTQGRYTFVSAVTLALVYLIFIRINRENRRVRDWGGFLLGSAALLLWAASYWNGRVDLLTHRQALRDSMIRWQATGTGLLYPWGTAADGFFRRAVELGWYRVPEVDLSAHISPPVEIELPSREEELRTWLDRCEGGERFIACSGWAYIPDLLTSEDEIYLVLRGPRRKHHVFTPARRLRSENAHWYEDRRLTYTGFFALIESRSLPPGKYRVGFFIRGRKASRLGFTARRLQLGATER